MHLPSAWYNARVSSLRNRECPGLCWSPSRRNLLIPHNVKTQLHHFPRPTAGPKPASQWVVAVIRVDDTLGPLLLCLHGLVHGTMARTARHVGRCPLWPCASLRTSNMHHHIQTASRLLARTGHTIMESASTRLEAILAAPEFGLALFIRRQLLQWSGRPWPFTPHFLSSSA
ncbi:hypothetical protein HDV57DRAFT_182389 [Trichoderma longibrachiatum]